MKSKSFALYAWGVLGYSVLVILWGAFVRATGSGAGCGSHWPLCNGVVVPRAAQLETLIEFSHRITSALSVALVAGLVVWGFRLYGKGAPIRRTLVLSGVLIILEALIGAGLVLFRLTADNESAARAVSMALHLVNTFLLLGVLAFTAWWASGGTRTRLRGRGRLGAGWWLGLSAVIVLGISGAVTALGDTLFPAETLAAGLAQDFSPTAHFLVRMRAWHPAIAILTGAFVMLLARGLAARYPGRETRRLARGLAALYILQLVAGTVNVVLLAPVWMQLVHLALATSVWVCLVLLGAASFADPSSG